ncbi:MAG: holo-[acyl-carrier-protein] synthase [Opitutaceae bacterium]|nr:holo-[acyl-carrier-protein] synthase [Opitutaceae bacterium]|tara:strand:+ start:3073 stop:3510 length:438 start_codon:yes stop_codon:yes gene_type:complete
MADEGSSLLELAGRFPSPAALLNVGVDVIEVDRVQKVYERQKDRFLKRVYTQEEVDYCFDKSNPFPHLAARFAAKEAVSKAFSTGIGKLFGWTSASVYHDPRMQPLIRLDHQGKKLLEVLGGTDVRITLSHTKGTAVAVAILVKV